MEAWSGLNQDCLSERFSASARDGAWCFYLAGSGAQLPLKEDDEHSFQLRHNKLKGNSKETQRKSLFPSWQRKRKKEWHESWSPIARHFMHWFSPCLKQVFINHAWLDFLSPGFPGFVTPSWAKGGGHLVPLQKPHRKVRQNGDKAFLFCLSRN